MTRLPAGVFLPEQDAAQVDFVLRRAVMVLAARDGMVPAPLVRLSEDVHKVADRFRAEALVSPGSGIGPSGCSPGAEASGTADQLTTRQLAALAQVSDSFIRRLVNRGTLPGVRTTGGGWAIDSGAAAVWLAGRSNTKAA